jgi:hypothetical protein
VKAEIQILVQMIREEGRDTDVDTEGQGENYESRYRMVRGADVDTDVQGCSRGVQPGV